MKKFRAVCLAFVMMLSVTGGTSGEFDGGILIETRKDGIVTHNIRVGGADKICVDKDNSTVYKISDDNYKTLEKVMDNYKL